MGGLDWNEPALFYKNLNQSMDEWTIFRLTEENLIRYSRKFFTLPFGQQACSTPLLFIF
jgi:hypothetical protein